MSRMTAAQVIAIGEYLHPDFDPATLTVPQLLGVFGYHNVQYPSPYTKSKLVQLFNDEIKPRSAKLKKEKIKRELSQASDDGITDGVTGRPINEGNNKPAPTPVRRSSRRVSRASTQEHTSDSEPARVEPPKRRRSSAEPSLGGPSKRKAARPAEPVVIEESEPEEEPIVRKVSRNRKSSAGAGSRARRVSQTLMEEQDDSGWDDNNIFQSGAESSSPMRPSPVRSRARRSSAVPRQVKARKSMSAPPQITPLSPKKDKQKERDLSVKPPESKFEPSLPTGLMRESRTTAPRSLRSRFDPGLLAQKQVVVIPDDLPEEHEEVEEPKDEVPPEAHDDVMGRLTEDDPNVLDTLQEEYDEDGDVIGDDDEQVTAVSRRIAEGGNVARYAPDTEIPSLPLFLRIMLALLALAGSGFIYNYKPESASIGFCDTGKTSNVVLQNLRQYRAAVEACNIENRTLLFASPDADGTQAALAAEPSSSVAHTSEGGAISQEGSDGSGVVCPAPALVPYLPHPESCAPCPKHASCTPSTMTCENGYILRPHPLLYLLPVPGTTPSPATVNAQQSFTLMTHSSAPIEDVSHAVYKVLSLAFDGLPGLGPAALPPRCVEDPRRKKHIGVLGKAVESMLAAERGRRLCAGVGVGLPEGDEITEAKRWGVEIEKLKEDIKKKTSPHLLPTLEDTFNEAIQQLVQWGGVFMGEDATGHRYLAHRTPNMDMQCTVKVKARNAWAEWNKSIISSLMLGLSVMAFRRRQARNVIDNERVASLVQIALDLLRNQELAHHIDPITAPQPYLSSLQLRDLVLQEEHSISTRRRLWERVERVVEGNANVRTNLEEVEGGDEMRVWRWVGSAGKALSPGARLQSSNANQGQFEERGEGGRIIA